MKKSTIWTIAVVMGLSFLGLLYLQISYIEQMARMKKAQFDESVKQSLKEVARNLELNETRRYLEKGVAEVERHAQTQDSLVVDGLNGTIQHSRVEGIVRRRYHLLIVRSKDLHHKTGLHSKGNDYQR